MCSSMFIPYVSFKTIAAAVLWLFQCKSIKKVRQYAYLRTWCLNFSGLFKRFRKSVCTSSVCKERCWSWESFMGKYLRNRFRCSWDYLHVSHTVENVEGTRLPSMYFRMSSMRKANPIRSCQWSKIIVIAQEGKNRYAQIYYHCPFNLVIGQW